MIKVRFYVLHGQQNPVQDYEMGAVPRIGDGVELTAADGSPIPFVVDQVTWTPHDVIPADVVIALIGKGAKAWKESQ
jgi:hypothetical protein